MKLTKAQKRELVRIIVNELELILLEPARSREAGVLERILEKLGVAYVLEAPPFTWREVSHET